MRGRRVLWVLNRHGRSLRNAYSWSCSYLRFAGVQRCRAGLGRLRQTGPGRARTRRPDRSRAIRRSREDGGRSTSDATPTALQALEAPGRRAGRRAGRPPQGAGRHGPAARAGRPVHRTAIGRRRPEADPRPRPPPGWPGSMLAGLESNRARSLFYEAELGAFRIPRPPKPAGRSWPATSVWPASILASALMARDRLIAGPLASEAAVERSVCRALGPGWRCRVAAPVRAY